MICGATEDIHVSAEVYINCERFFCANFTKLISGLVDMESFAFEIDAQKCFWGKSMAYVLAIDVNYGILSRVDETIAITSSLFHFNWSELKVRGQGEKRHLRCAF